MRHWHHFILLEGVATAIFMSIWKNLLTFQFFFFLTPCLFFFLTFFEWSVIEVGRCVLFLGVLKESLLCISVDDDTLMALAHQKYKAGNYKHALEHSNAVYERNPHRTDNLLLLGAIHYQVVSQVFCFLFFILFLSCIICTYHHKYICSYDLLPWMVEFFW